MVMINHSNDLPNTLYSQSKEIVQANNSSKPDQRHLPKCHTHSLPIQITISNFPLPKIFKILNPVALKALTMMNTPRWWVVNTITKIRPVKLRIGIIYGEQVLHGILFRFSVARYSHSAVLTSSIEKTILSTLTSQSVLRLLNLMYYLF